MARYIDADSIPFYLHKGWDLFIADKQDIDKIPTADVVEVKHGEWIDKYGNKYANHLYVCSVCGKEALCEFYTNELGQIKERQALTVGCPHCLAKMDGGKKE